MNICRVLRLSGKVWISWQFSCVICEEKNRYLTGSRHHVSGNSVLEGHGNVEHTPRERKRTPEPCSQPHDHWTTNTEDRYFLSCKSLETLLDSVSSLEKSGRSMLTISYIIFFLIFMCMCGRHMHLCMHTCLWVCMYVEAWSWCWETFSVTVPEYPFALESLIQTQS